jgi:hypothetical protein
MKIVNIYSWLHIESYVWRLTRFLHVTISFQYVKTSAILQQHVDFKTVHHFSYMQTHVLYYACKSHHHKIPQF